jgi:ribonuclease P protein component
VKRRFRLTRTTDFKRVRRFGRSFAHPLVVLVVLPDEAGKLRFGITAGKSVGGAVQRNRAKRILRSVLRPLLLRSSSGWHAVLIARKPILDAPFTDVQSATQMLLKRAGLLRD